MVNIKLMKDESVSPPRPKNQTGFSLVSEALKYDFAMRPWLDKVEKELI